MPINEVEKHQRIIYLIHSFNSQSISEEELEELTVWLDASTENKRLFEEISNPQKQKKASTFMNAVDTGKALEKIKKRVAEAHTKRRIWRLSLTAAACLILLGSGYLFKNLAIFDKPTKIYSLLPEGQKAVLIVNNGKVVTLNEDANPSVIQEGNVRIKQEAGTIDYSQNDNAAAADEAEYNTIKTPKGGQYKVILSDGTKVHLNAATTLTYPTKFLANERKVELEGEAFFEVTENPDKTFIVKSGLQEVKVLGTHFNVNAYQADAFVKTSLLEGSISLSSRGNAEKILVPGEIAKLNRNTMKLQIDKISTKDMALWRSGKFRFEEETIEEIMKRMARWYNIDVEYKGAIHTDLYSGTISKYQNLQDALSMLELTNKVKFEILENKVVVMNKNIGSDGNRNQ